MVRGRSQPEAEELVDNVDSERVEYIRKYFGAEWPARTIYHAMINTALGDEAVVRVITDFVTTMGGAKSHHTYF
jgi:hypothetical protein